MRTIRAVRARVPEDRRQEYLSLLKEYGELANASALVKGFYVMENEAAPGDVYTYVEFADGEAARAFEAEGHEHPGLRDVLRKLREVISAGQVESSLWRQRI